MKERVCKFRSLMIEAANDQAWLMNKLLSSNGMYLCYTKFTQVWEKFKHLPHKAWWKIFVATLLKWLGPKMVIYSLLVAFLQ